MTTTLTADQIATITSAVTWQDASALTGKIDPRNSHFVKLAYIKAILGPRSTGGFFDPTKANVTVKFAHAWEAANATR